MSAEPAAYTEPKQQLRKRSRKADIVAPQPRGIRLPKAVRRLQRNAPAYAMQGLVELSTRLRQMTGHEVIDLNRIMELAQFAYQQREVARRGANYVVDDFGFDPQWTESLFLGFKIQYSD
jgi:hypothetical protein